MKEILTKIQSLANRGMFDKAMDLLEKTLSTISSPEDRITINNNKALIFYKKGDTSYAKELFEENLRNSIEIAYEFGEETALYHLGQIYLSKGDPEMGYQITQRLIDRFQAERSETDEFRARITMLQALINLLEGNHVEAINRGRECLTLFSELKNQEEVEESLNLIAGAYKGKGDFNRSLYTYRELLMESSKSNNIRSLTKCYNNIAVIYRTTGNYKQALNYFRRYLELVEATGDKYFTAIGYTNLGRTYKDKGDLQRALQYLRMAEQIFLEEGNLRGLALTLGEIAETYHNLHDLEKAREYFEQTFAYYKKTGVLELYSERLAGFINLLIDLQELDTAETILMELQELASKKESKTDSIYYQYQKANLELARGDIGSAKENFLTLLGEVEVVGIFNILIKIYLNLARIFFESYTVNGEESDLETARVYVNTALEKSMREKLFPSAVNALMVQAMFYVNEARLQEALDILEKAIAISEERGLEDQKQRIKQLIEQLLHRNVLISSSVDRLEKNSYNELARTETALVLKSVLGKREKIYGKRENWLARSYLIVFLITPAGPKVHYADMLPLKGGGKESQETAYGQLALFITLAIQQGREDNVPEGLFGPLPVADMEEHFVYVYSSTKKMVIGPAMVCFMIPKESISLFFDRQNVLNTFTAFFKDLSFKEINEESIVFLKQELFGIKVARSSDQKIYPANSSV
ncbi:MAG: tetratricopeptide repeat protein [Candidatus Odinarchaeota archaeon]